MASLEGVLAAIPGYAGYLGQRQMNEQAGAQELQQFGAVQGVLANLAAQQQKQQEARKLAAYEQAVRALGDNPDQASLARVASQFGAPGEVMKTMQSSLDRQSAQKIAQMNAETASADRRYGMDQRLQEVELRGQQAIDRVREEAAQRRITQQEADARESRIRENMIRLTASLRPAPQEQPLVSVMKDGKPTLVTRSQAVGMTPASSATRGTAMSATAQKELIQTDEEIQAGQQALSYLGEAAKINDKAMGFLGAGAVASVGTLLPNSMRPATVDATNELDNLVQNSALPQMKAIFGTNPTEGERKILMDVAGASSKSPNVREGIYKRAAEAIKRRVDFSKKKAGDLRSGTYFSAPAGGNDGWSDL